jgi:hypothetical protein
MLEIKLRILRMLPMPPKKQNKKLLGEELSAKTKQKILHGENSIEGDRCRTGQSGDIHFSFAFLNLSPSLHLVFFFFFFVALGF